MAEDEGFLRRWSRRKELAQREQLAPPAGDAARRPDQDDVAATQQVRGVPPEVDGPSREGDGSRVPAAVADLPDIGSLSTESDFTAFMQDGVPEELRKTALQRLWRLDPVFANLDGLLEYGEDYTDAATVVENLKTAYRVGRGFMDDEEQVAAAGEAVEALPAEAGTASPVALEGSDAEGAATATQDAASPDDKK